MASYTVADPEFAQMEAAFLFSRERFNVAASRARRKFILVISRRIFDAISHEEDDVDAVQSLRRFVFGTDHVLIANCQIRKDRFGLWRFEPNPSSTALPLSSSPPSDASESLPELTPELDELDRTIRKMAKLSKWNSVADYELRKALYRDIAIGDLRDLLRLGRIRLVQRTAKSTFWAAYPQEHPTAPYTLEDSKLSGRVIAVIEELTGRTPARYDKVRDRFVWLDTFGNDLF